MRPVPSTQPEADGRDACPVVFHVRTVTDTGGGPEKTILHSPRYLESTGFRAWCVYLHPPRDPGFETIRRRAEACNAPLLEFDDRGPFDLGVLRRLYQACREYNVAIWHGHDYKSDTIGLLLRRVHRMHLVSTVHGWGVYTPRAMVYNRIHRFVLRFFDRIVCVSDDMYTQCRRASIAARLCRVIRNGIEIGVYQPAADRRSAKRALELPDTRTVIGFVGRLSNEKDIPTLLEAAATWKSQGGNPHVLLVGDGPDRTRIAECADRLGLNDHITWAGFQSDPLPYYQAMDIFALPSLREGLPNVLLEAMAVVVPVVASRVGGIPQAIDNEKTGLLVSPGDYRQMAGAFARLANDWRWASQLARAARSSVEQRYSFARRMERMAALYRELLSKEKIART